jgi:TonB family protein
VQTQEDIQQSASTTAKAHKHLQANARSKQQSHSEAAMASEVSSSITTTRTILPPLEIEVIAGDGHHKLRTRSNSVQLDLARGSAPAGATPSVPVDPGPVPASVISKAAERVQVSSDVASMVTHAVPPAYPILARQMKVQGSVILQAVIGRDGLIEDLQILSGPPILAGAATEAVRQWHFKPHYVGAEPVETDAKITVNFTISRN